MKNAHGAGNSSKLVIACRTILAFICSVFLFVILFMVGIRITMFSQKYMLKQIEESGYYQETAKDINRQIENYGLGSNIPAGVLNEIVNPSLVKKNTENYINASYKGMAFESYDKDKIKKRVTETILAYADKENIDITQNSKKGIEKLSEESYDIFLTYIKIPYLTSYGQKILQFNSSFLMLLMIMIMAFIFTSVLLLYLLHWWLHRILRYTSFVFSGAGLMVAAFPFYLLCQKYIDRIGITSKGLYLFITLYLKNILWTLTIIGISFYVVGIIFFILSVYERNKRIAPEFDEEVKDSFESRFSRKVN